VSNGIAVRMALLFLLAGAGGEENAQAAPSESAARAVANNPKDSKHAAH
jgi:hypothetical protein